MTKEDKQERKLAKKHPILKWVLLTIVVVILLWICGFLYLGGYKFECANVEEFKKYAASIEDMDIPGNVEIVALGEATHGNKEFQALKLEVFKHLVEKNGVRTLAIEADYTSCLAANEYIHGGKGSAIEAVKTLGFRIYETQQMVDLLEYMRKFNETAKAGDYVNIYGIDIQSMKEEPKNLSNEEAQHYADCIKQHEELAELYKQGKMWGEGGYNEVRDTYMTKNVSWILEKEKVAGRNMIFLTGHNGHIAKYENTKDMGSQLSQKYGEKYYTIGTDFYKTKCTLRSGSSNRYSAHTFFSHDPLSVAAHKCSIDICLLDFSKIPSDSALRKDIDEYVKMGSLGENFSILNRFLPNSYQLLSCPSKLYNSLVIVTNASPTELLD